MRYMRFTIQFGLMRRVEFLRFFIDTTRAFIFFTVPVNGIHQVEPFRNETVERPTEEGNERTVSHRVEARRIQRIEAVQRTEERDEGGRSKDPPLSE